MLEGLEALMGLCVAANGKYFEGDKYTYNNLDNRRSAENHEPLVSVTSVLIGLRIATAWRVLR